MSDTRLFFVAGTGMLAGGILAGVLFGDVLVRSPLGALLLATAIAGGGAVLVNKVVPA
jgi:hypothetical protein